MSDDATSDKKQNNLSISLDVDDQLTWAELFAFVDQARKNGARPNDRVPPRYDHHDEFIGFVFHIEPDSLA